jgi:hypothetical protein
MKMIVMCLGMKDLFLKIVLLTNQHLPNWEKNGKKTVLNACKTVLNQKNGFLTIPKQDIVSVKLGDLSEGKSVNSWRIATLVTVFHIQVLPHTLRPQPQTSWTTTIVTEV